MRLLSVGEVVKTVEITAFGLMVHVPEQRIVLCHEIEEE
jgi:hypothetical protein